MILLVLPWKQVALARYQLQQLQHLLQNPIAEWVPLLHPLLATQRVRASRRKLAQSTVLRFLTSPLILSRMTEGLEVWCEFQGPGCIDPSRPLEVLLVGSQKRGKLTQLKAHTPPHPRQDSEEETVIGKRRKNSSPQSLSQPPVINR